MRLRDMDQSASHTNLQPRSPSLLTRLTYAVGALSVIPATIVGDSSWIGLATGGMPLARFGAAVFLLIGGAILFRLYQVLRYPRALEAWSSSWVARGFRGLALVTMFVSGLAGIGLFFVRPITYALMKTPGENGIGFFVVGLLLVVVANAGWKGCVVYEIARLAGRPPRNKQPPSPFHWKQDAIAAAAVVAICATVLIFQTVTASQRCEGIRIACVATTQVDLNRMVTLPVGTPVHFQSDVKAIDLRKNSGSRSWALSESPVVSLEASGYPPTDDADAAVRVTVEATQSQEGVVMRLLVWEGSEQTARFTTKFARGSKLERDEEGSLHIVVEPPSNIDSMIRGVYQDKQGHQYMLDQIYVLLRQAIGTEQETRESAMRLVRTPRLASETESNVRGPSAEMRSTSDVLIDTRCADLLTMNRNGPVRSATIDILGVRMSEVRFSRSPGDSLFTNIHNREHIVCKDGGILIVSYWTANPLFSMRLFSEDGKLLRYVQSTLPATKDGYDFIDMTTLRASENAITFDRVGAKFNVGKEIFTKRESFEIPLGSH